MKKQTLRDINLAGKKVLVRVDYNVPILPDGTVGDLYRVAASVPTIKYLLEQNCKVVLISHLGRPEGKKVSKYTLRPIAHELTHMLGRKVLFTDDCLGAATEAAVKKLRAGQVLLLENLRFYKDEEKNNATFAEQLSRYGEVFVQDGFGVVHRAHASTDAITKYLPSVAGLLLEKEVDIITKTIEKPKPPFVAVLGGAKVSDKIELLERFADTADQLLIGGAMANTFLKASGRAIGKSVYETGQEAVIERIIKKLHKRIADCDVCRENAKHDKYDVLNLDLPTDVAVAAAIDKRERRAIVDAGDVKPSEYILDLGPDTIHRYVDAIRDAATIIWNGPVGFAEIPQFAYGSNYIAAAIKNNNKAKTIIGGGDTAAFIMQWDPDKGKKFTHISTGGGASLELMSGKKLPGVEALLDK